VQDIAQKLLPGYPIDRSGNAGSGEIPDFLSDSPMLF